MLSTLVILKLKSPEGRACWERARGLNLYISIFYEFLKAGDDLDFLPPGEIGGV